MLFMIIIDSVDLFDYFVEKYIVAFIYFFVKDNFFDFDIDILWLE